MADEKNGRDYKGWISLLIGACAVWIAYESFVWQKNQAEQNQPDNADPGQQSTGGSSDNSPSSGTYSHEPATSDSKVESPDEGPKSEKGNQKKKKNR